MESELSLRVLYALTQRNDAAILGGCLCTSMGAIFHTINYNLLVFIHSAETGQNNPKHAHEWAQLKQLI